MKIANALSPLALVLALAAGTVSADSELPLDEVAEQVRQEIRLIPNASGGTSHQTVTVEVKNDTLVLMGFVEGLEERQAINDVLRNIDGLHANQIDDHIVVQ